MKKVSVVVPIHNAELYLAQCIESIVGQSYENMEVHLMEDNSTDRSREICREYENKYPQICVHTEISGSAGKSRDLGIQYATGHYVMFVDADDYLYDNQVVERMVEVAEMKKADIVVGNYARLWKERLLPATEHDVFSGYDRESVAFRFDGFFRIGTLSYVWAKLYRKDFLTDNQIHFKSYVYGEDKLFNCNCYMHKAKYGFLQEKVYVYRKNDQSISFTYRAESWKTWIAIAEDLNMENAAEDLIGNTIFFAAFFDAKQEYEYKQKNCSAVRELLKCYGNNELARRCFCTYSRRKMVKEFPSLMWRIMIRGFSTAMKRKWYGLLVLGIKMLVDLKIDERLSDTGKRE